ncbi:MAG: 16S rRNA (guanine(527)-N(7))-methyltransferase RsmG [Pseudomonadota bacterium]
MRLGDLDVSRETIDRLEIYETLLRKWNSKINLVGRSTLEDVWTRHFLDSAQLFEIAAHPVQHWADLGSGAGFPGMVIAILASEKASPGKITMVESDVRKCTFLRSVLRETDISATVINERIENVPPLDANVISARALASLSALFKLALPHLSSDGQVLFPKGEKWRTEVADAQSKWQFEHQVVKSRTSDGPVILRATGVARV